jgi:hypothetical protein
VAAVGFTTFSFATKRDAPGASKFEGWRTCLLVAFSSAFARWETMRRWGNCKEGSEELICVIGEEFYAGMVGSHCIN